VHTNTNLGIVLLCAPLAAAAERHAGDLRAGVVQVLDALDAEDAAGAFQAIVRAWPAGLGRSPVHDVFEPARVTLRKAMAAAADRDRVAYNYASAFEDVFERGEPWLAAALARMPDRKWATLAVYLGFLAAFPDSHIVRKHGRVAAEDVRRQAARFHARLLAGDPQKLLPDLLAWDASLKANSLNPGTSADLTVVTLFADRLRRILPPARNGGSL
jgi:triphosphoribosyl-dephospho-CoA synthase